ncbi:MAG: hypothetical protein R2849_15990 [Thermomicrobiales bacterium]
MNGSWTIYDEIEDLVIPDDLAAAWTPPAKPAATSMPSPIQPRRSSSGGLRPEGTGQAPRNEE